MSELEGDPGLVRLTTLEMRTAYRRPPGRRRRRDGWRTIIRDAPSNDRNHELVDVASAIPPIEAAEGSELVIRVRWVAPPPVELTP